MPKFSITTEEVWPHKVFYTITAKTLEAAMAKIQAGEATHYDQRIGEVAGDCVIGVYEVKQNGKPMEVPVHLAGGCDTQPTDKRVVTPDVRLARFWRSRAGIEYSDFDAIAGNESEVNDKKPAPSRISRGEAIDFRMRSEALDKLRATERETAQAKYMLEKVKTVADYIAMGLPLSREEYYMALAMGYIMGDRPYEEFYQTRWHETKEGRGYTPLPQ